ncbi:MULTISPECIES: TetR/AcrR family transcriptional regulator [Chryseobacterium]|uniref:TetR/AcrR family transcriptional regulator n=1 Tax=Chryseobacterium rhizosphaerae TaxID=395937 RepID=A0ABX9IPL5_9FLAO|nr:MULTISPECIES: TetR/AcrR family transcriptional regulator [Chryseobacterium]MBL3548219.1 TetR/AcrR family transcriptional regulator [Chryseobacterium sp. KMC2]MDC8098841.1 TetR/AcrR family transcriptional regulator [Chryseobacterium rhizosphaerae]MDR6547961.1 AcrR family transcriptional regulator [Chryseobacterium rhizosphaerae]REC76608.1 TetR/AcrR family transcriptional regulator [Chryseobacterium rhizosphaerae]GEN66812.1 TetR family transcriptional regulator [Chryseobacterium rhizosphaerae
MMKTKEKILLKALELFNEKGYTTITTRHIAAELNISPGNLHYHFKHSEDIIKILFQELVLKMDELLNTMKEMENNTLENLYQFTFSTCKIFYSFRFIFVNFVDILKEIPEIRSQYEEIHTSRKEEFQMIFSGLQKNNIFKKDVPEFMMDSLIQQIFIIADNWLTHNRLILKLDQEAAISHYTLLQMNLFYPFLNKEQQKLYEKQYITPTP